ncbi:hypothetical protein GCM10023149_11750 [Mucilaginibacter gynuensis]|uniref:SRPBCC family protein n=1 Tax=Mucilaginibacter gynuensis TaxID=1302236 RepID=A0ABP8G161_9SPHI
MTLFESTVNIARPVSEVYQFLNNLNNHQQLMPESIQDWRSTADEASFTIKNMAKLALVVESRIENSVISIVAADTPPFEIKLQWLLAQEAEYTSVQFTIAAELNMMMKMLASGPLQKLADHETQTLGTILG